MKKNRSILKSVDIAYFVCHDQIENDNLNCYSYVSQWLNLENDVHVSIPTTIIHDLKSIKFPPFYCPMEKGGGTFVLALMVT